MNKKALKEYLQNRSLEVNNKLSAYDHLIEVFKAIGAQEELNRLVNVLEQQEAGQKPASNPIQGDSGAQPPQITITNPVE